MNLYKQGLNDEEIAERQDVHPSSVRGWRRRRNLSPNHKPGDNFKEPPSKKNLKRAIFEFENLKEVANHFDVHKVTLRKWLSKMDFPKTSRGEFTVPWIRMSYNKKDIIKTSKKYSAAEAARKYNVGESSVRRFLRQHNIDWTRNGSNRKPEKKKIEPFLPIRGDYFKLKNCGCDYLIVKDKNQCALVEEKSSLQHRNWQEATIQLLTGEKIVKNHFGLSPQRKIIYCENPSFDSLEKTLLKRVEKYLGIEFWRKDGTITSSKENGGS